MAQKRSCFVELLQLKVDEAIQRNDRIIMERREKLAAATAAAEKILYEFIRFHKGNREDITGEELVAIIFGEFESVPKL